MWIWWFAAMPIVRWNLISEKQNCWFYLHQVRHPGIHKTRNSAACDCISKRMERSPANSFTAALKAKRQNSVISSINASIGGGEDSLLPADWCSAAYWYFWWAANCTHTPQQKAIDPGHSGNNKKSRLIQNQFSGSAARKDLVFRKILYFPEKSRNFLKKAFFDIVWA